MSEKDLSDTSRTDWAALEAMNDESIDYSDIPPLTDEFFKNASLRVRIPSHQVPTLPGQTLDEAFLQPMNITQKELAESIRLPLNLVSDIVSGKACITPSSSLRLAKYFGNSADFWMSLQIRWDLYRAQKVESEALASIQPCQLAQAG